MSSDHIGFRSRNVSSALNSEPPPTSSSKIAIPNTFIKKSKLSVTRIFSSPLRRLYLLGIVLIIHRIANYAFDNPNATSVKQVDDETTTTTNNNNNNNNNIESPIIPHIIHQSYKTSTLPPHWSKTPATWKTHNPTYEYRFWTDDDNRRLIRSKYPWFLETYDSYPYDIQRADAARYFSILTYGGIYADLDILSKRDVTPLLQRLRTQTTTTMKELIVAETFGLGLTNALFAAVKNSTVLGRFVREELMTHAKPWGGLLAWLSPHFGVLFSTGPTRFWMFLNGYRDKIETLHPSLWGECHPCHGRLEERADAYFTTVKGGSWYHWDTAFFNFLMCRPELVVWMVLLGISIVRITSCSCCSTRRESRKKSEDSTPLIQNGNINLIYSGKYLHFTSKKVVGKELVAFIAITILLIV